MWKVNLATTTSDGTSTYCESLHHVLQAREDRWKTKGKRTLTTKNRTQRKRNNWSKMARRKTKRELKSNLNQWVPHFHAALRSFHQVRDGNNSFKDTSVFCRTCPKQVRFMSVKATRSPRQGDAILEYTHSSDARCNNHLKSRCGWEVFYNGNVSNDDTHGFVRPPDSTAWPKNKKKENNNNNNNKNKNKQKNKKGGRTDWTDFSGWRSKRGVGWRRRKEARRGRIGSTGSEEKGTNRNYPASQNLNAISIFFFFFLQFCSVTSLGMCFWFQSRTCAILWELLALVAHIRTDNCLIRQHTTLSPKVKAEPVLVLLFAQQHFVCTACGTNSEFSRQKR